MFINVKCKKCRNTIINTLQCPNLLINAHHEPINITNNECHTISNENLIFLTEDLLPDWVMQKIQEAEWSKGKLNCTNCDSKIGGFDFISGIRCECTGNTLPPVHLVKSKVDLVKS